MEDFNDDDLLRYSRHLLLAEIDLSGQELLHKARALIVGAGGLGSPVALYLASAGLGKISIADDDTVELSNLQRQIIHDNSCLGTNKATSAAKRLQALNTNIEVHAICERLSKERLMKIVREQDIVLDCSDNYATRQAINAACFNAKVPMVSGSAVRFSGQLSVYDSRDNTSPCYSCLFPAENQASDGPCSTFGVFAPLVGVIGSLQAVEAIKIICNINVIKGRLTLYDAQSGEFNLLNFIRNPACTVCGAV